MSSPVEKPASPVGFAGSGRARERHGDYRAVGDRSHRVLRGRDGMHISGLSPGPSSAGHASGRGRRPGLRDRHRFGRFRGRLSEALEHVAFQPLPSGGVRARAPVIVPPRPKDHHDSQLQSDPQQARPRHQRAP